MIITVFFSIKQVASDEVTIANTLYHAIDYSNNKISVDQDLAFS